MTDVISSSDDSASVLSCFEPAFARAHLMTLKYILQMATVDKNTHCGSQLRYVMDNNKMYTFIRILFIVICNR